MKKGSVVTVLDDKRNVPAPMKKRFNIVKCDAGANEAREKYCAPVDSTEPAKNPDGSIMMIDGLMGKEVAGYEPDPEKPRKYMIDEKDVVIDTIDEQKIKEIDYSKKLVEEK